MNKHFNITVSGKVQGVLFRKHCQEKAAQLRLTGFVQNLPNGSVWIEAEGPVHALNQLVIWCQDGSPRSEVISVKYAIGEIQGYTDFEVK
jgi:acylphosphatase